jgi:hypothetical protein
LQRASRRKANNEVFNRNYPGFPVKFLGILGEEKISHLPAVTALPCPP